MEIMMVQFGVLAVWSDLHLVRINKRPVIYKIDLFIILGPGGYNLKPTFADVPKYLMNNAPKRY